jgi:hypothetical protein
MTGMSVLTDAILATLKAFAGDRLLKGLEGKVSGKLAQAQKLT